MRRAPRIIEDAPSPGVQLHLQIKDRPERQDLVWPTAYQLSFVWFPPLPDLRYLEEALGIKVVRECWKQSTSSLHLLFDYYGMFHDMRFKFYPESYDPAQFQCYIRTEVQDAIRRQLFRNGARDASQWQTLTNLVGQSIGDRMRGALGHYVGVASTQRTMEAIRQAAVEQMRGLYPDLSDIDERVTVERSLDGEVSMRVNLPLQVEYIPFRFMMIQREAEPLGHPSSEQMENRRWLASTDPEAYAAADAEYGLPFRRTEGS